MSAVDKNMNDELSLVKKGKLKIFLGMCPGVGKTYAMLQMAHSKSDAGCDVVAGIVETHGRKETEDLLGGLEILPLKKIEYKSTAFEEFDIDAMIKRRPQIALIDELAHSNIESSRHAKRYLDVKELLENGIDVYTTLNVQHIESRLDSIESVSGIRISERVPDAVIAWADEIEIIDISPESLRKRLVEGKVYMGEKAVRASDEFFSLKNLSALRELALRVTAQHVNKELVEILKLSRNPQPMQTGERILVAVGSSPFSEKIVRWTKRYADALNASWLAVNIDTGQELTGDAKGRLDKNMELARSMGAEMVSYAGDDITESILTVARRELATQIVAGRSNMSAISKFFKGGTLTDKLVAKSGAIAVHVLPSSLGSNKVRWQRIFAEKKFPLKEYAAALGMSAGLTLVSLAMLPWLGSMPSALLFLTLTAIGGLILTRGPVLLLAVTSAVFWNFFLTTPRFSFDIKSNYDIIVFCLLLFIAIAMGQLTSKMSAMKENYRRREVRAFALYKFLSCLSSNFNFEDTVSEAVSHLREVTNFDARLCIGKELSLKKYNYPDDAQFSDKDMGVIKWVTENNAFAGAGTETLSHIDSLFMPVCSHKKVCAVLALKIGDARLSNTVKDLVVQMANLLAASIEREQLKQNAASQRDLQASQKLQKTLLDAVSHELKTPLSVVLSALEQCKILVEQKNTSDALKLLSGAENSSKRLLRNVNMLLDMTRFENKIIAPKNEIIDMPDIADRILSELKSDYPDNRAEFKIEPECEILRSDETLIYQLINQLVRNAFEHSKSTAPVVVEISSADDFIKIAVSDFGCGISQKDRDYIFNSFYRAGNASRGLGLGLSISKRICESVGGALNFEDNIPSGAKFTATIPQK